MLNGLVEFIMDARRMGFACLVDKLSFGLVGLSNFFPDQQLVVNTFSLVNYWVQLICNGFGLTLTQSFWAKSQRSGFWSTEIGERRIRVFATLAPCNS